MTYALVIRRLAEAELAEAVAWYDLQAPGLGAELLDQFEKDAKTILEAPLRWPIAIDDVRRFVMRRFPYIMYYELRDDNVRMLRFVHASMDPEVNQRLLEKYP